MANLTPTQVDELFNTFPEMGFIYFDDEGEEGFFSFAERESWFRGDYTRNGVGMITGGAFSHMCENHHAKYGENGERI